MLCNFDQEKIHKKLKLVLPWYERINLLETAQFENYLAPILLKTLKTISFYAELLVKTATGEEYSINHVLSRFDIKEIEKKVSKSVKEIVEEVQIESPEEQVAKEGKTWKPKDAVEGKVEEQPRNLPANYPQPDPNYIAPDELPQPIEDWIIEF